MRPRYYRDQHRRVSDRLVVVLAVGEHCQHVEYSASQGAVSGMWTKPFSISAVCACKRMVFSVGGW